MKINFQTGSLALIALATIVYLALPVQSEEKRTALTAKTQPTSSEKRAITATPNSKAEWENNTAAFSNEKQVWKPISTQRPNTLPDGLHAEYIKVEENIGLTFSKGQKLSFFIPQENNSYAGTISESAHVFEGDIKIFSGDIENGNELASFSITESKNTTFVTIATGESIYQVEIDNHSGIGTVLDDRELNQYRLHDDAILPPPEGVS